MFRKVAIWTKMPKLQKLCATGLVASTFARFREAEGLRPLVHFLSSAARLTRAAAAVAVEKCAANEANKELLRELGAIEPLLQMLSGAPGVDVLSSALGALPTLRTHGKRCERE